MLKSLSLTLVALSSYVLFLPVVCNTLMTNEIRVAQAVEGEANVLDELLEVPEFIFLQFSSYSGDSAIVFYFIHRKKILSIR